MSTNTNNREYCNQESNTTSSLDRTKLAIYESMPLIELTTMLPQEFRVPFNVLFARYPATVRSIAAEEVSRLATNNTDRISSLNSINIAPSIDGSTQGVIIEEEKTWVDVDHSLEDVSLD